MTIVFHIISHLRELHDLDKNIFPLLSTEYMITWTFEMLLNGSKLTEFWTVETYTKVHDRLAGISYPLTMETIAVSGWTMLLLSCFNTPEAIREFFCQNYSLIEFIWEAETE